MAWTVYTLWNYAGELVYAGQTRDVSARVFHHMDRQPWAAEIKDVRRGATFSTEREARDAEYSIIAAENPKYNWRGRDICPRCKAALRGRDRKAVYCAPCQTAYQLERRRALGVRPPKPPSVTCPRCGGIKPPGPSYCAPCKKQINAEYQKNQKAKKSLLTLY
jgi:predicted GIY-YIG superfamily endonuclease